MKLRLVLIGCVAFTVASASAEQTRTDKEHLYLGLGTHFDATSKPLIPERDLRRILGRIAGEDRGRFDETAWLVRTANALIDLGTTKARYVFDVYRRTLEGTDGEQDWEINQLMRLVFEVPNPPGYPSEDPQTVMTALRPHFRRGTRFPMIVFDDIPFEMQYGMSFRSGPAYWPLDYHKYKVRTKRLRPPDDPFLACERLIKSDEWPFPAHSKSDDRFAIPFKEMEGNAMKQALELVFDVYQPVDYRSFEMFNGLDIEKYRRGFLKTGARWSDRLQRYVRPDGVTLREKPDRPTLTWMPPTKGNAPVTITLHRRGDSDSLDFDLKTDYQTAIKVHPAFARLTDTKTGVLIAEIGVGRSFGNLSENKPTPSDEEKYLRGPDMTEGYSEQGVGITLPLNTAVRVEWVTRERVFQGPVLKP